MANRIAPGDSNALRVTNAINKLGDALDAAQAAIDADGTLSANSDDRIPTQKAVKTYVDAAAGGAPANADYLVRTANGILSAERVVTDTATITWDWGTGGQAKANLNFTIDTDTTLSANSDSYLATQKAVKAYVDASAGAPSNADYLVRTANGALSAERVVTDTATIVWDWSTGGQAKANLNYTIDTDGALAANSDGRLSTQKAVKTYVDNQVAGISIAGNFAMWVGTMTWTAGSGSTSSIDTANELITITSHGLVSGDCFMLTSNPPGGVSTLRAYYVNVNNANQFSLHTTYATAIAGTSKVNLTSTTTGGNWRKLVFVTNASVNMNATHPAGYITAQDAIGLEFRPSDASLLTGFVLFQIGNLQNIAASSNFFNTLQSLLPQPSSWAANLITYANANIPVSCQGRDSTPGNLSQGSAIGIPGTHTNQGTNTLSVALLIFG